MKKEISIILPVYNEKDSIEVMIRLLQSTLKFTYEIIIVYDHASDSTVPVVKNLLNEFSNIKLVFNYKSPGVMNAVDVGIENSFYDIILIATVDEIFPIISVEKMTDLIIQHNYDFVSGTRYSKGGLRIGGSYLGSILSKYANKIFQILTKIPLSDCTTGIKLMKKNVWKSVKLKSKPIGWAFSFELAIHVWAMNYYMTEYPIKSVDRLFGGASTFKPISWIKEYSKCFFWGLKVKFLKKKNTKI